MRSQSQPALVLLAAAAYILTTPRIAHAQTNERIYEELDFRFVTPGARAIGMGQAFIGLADDATAANSNPAGLSNLLQPEFSLEFSGIQIRHHRFITARPDGLETQRFGDFVLVPSFISFALPAGRTTFLVFRNSVQNYQETFHIPARFNPVLGAREDDAFGSMSVVAENTGLGVSWVANPTISVGGSVVLSSIDVATESRSGAANNPRNGSNTIDADLAATFIAGVLIKPARHVSVGVAYYGGSTFNLTTTLFGNFLYNDVPPPGLRLTGDRRAVDYVIPARYSAGASWQLRDDFTVLADVSRVRYSTQITDNFQIVDFLDPSAGLTRENFFINDVTELHAGAEYRLYRPRTTWAFRGGMFTDPDHQMHYRSGSNSRNHIADSLLDFRFNTLEQRTDVGGTAGFGVAVANRFQIDAAVSLSRDSQLLVVSTVVRLK